MIAIILIAVGLVVVTAMTHSPWSAFTVFATIPIALLVGFYHLRNLRPGRVVEGSAIALLLLAVAAVAAGGWVDSSPAWVFNLQGETLAGFVIVYGLVAAILPVWLLLAPRSYLSTFIKLGSVFLAGDRHLSVGPEVKMPAFTRFIDVTGPILSGKVFLSPSLRWRAVRFPVSIRPFAGELRYRAEATRARDRHSRWATVPWRWSRWLASWRGDHGRVRAGCGCVFAINTAAGVVGADSHTTTATITGWAFESRPNNCKRWPAPPELQKANFATATWGEQTFRAYRWCHYSLSAGGKHLRLRLRTGHARNVYHFAIMFERSLSSRLSMLAHELRAS